VQLAPPPLFHGQPDAWTHVPVLEVPPAVLQHDSPDMQGCPGWRPHTQDLSFGMGPKETEDNRPELQQIGTAASDLQHAGTAVLSLHSLARRMQ